MSLLSYPAGYLLGSLYPPLADEDPWARVAVRLLLGLAAWPVLLALTTVLGLRLGTSAVVAYVAVTTFAALVLAARQTATRLTAATPADAGATGPVPGKRVGPAPASATGSLRRPPAGGPVTASTAPAALYSSPASTASEAEFVSRRGYAISLPRAHDLALLVILAATLALRWWQAQAVVWPLWGDAVNHTAATALILQHGAIPPNWEPYIPTSLTFSYHFGFHAWAAAASWLTSVEPWWAVFWTERFLSIITPLSLYLLAWVFFRDRRVALGAALASGLLTLMPQYYLNWSRNPQLGGQAMLPLLAYLALASAAHRRTRLGAAGLLTLSVASLVFVHYRVLVFALGLFCGLAILIRQGGWRRFVTPAAAAAAGVAVGAPWVWHVLAVQRQVAALTPTSYAEGFVQAYFGVPPLWEYISPAVLALAAAGVLAGLARWWRQVLALLVWLLSLALAANGYRTGLSSLSLITYISVFMALYLPVSLGVGMATERFLRATRSQRTERLLLGSALLLSVLIGFALHADIVDDTYVLVRAEDVRAFDWIRDSTPPEALFLVNSFSASGEDGVVVGSDAGWWLPLATGRSASVPVINYGTEVASPEYVAQVRHLSRLSAEDPASDEARRAFCEAGITHVFVGSVGGPIPTDRLTSHPSFRLLHQDGGALVFALDCAP